MNRHVWRTMRFGAMTIFSILTIGCQKKSLLDLPAPSSDEVSETSEYPAVVKVILPGGRGLCSGTFVSARAVLTAAHCLPASGSYTIVSSFGTFTTNKMAKYGPGVVDDPNDIGLLYFDRDVASEALGQVASIGSRVSSGETLRLVGFGCKDVVTRRGSGVKRSGTNVVYELNEYIEFLTPRSTVGSYRGIIGASNRAGACFGDSGGPAAETREDGSFIVKGVAHTGGEDDDNYVSDYVDMSRGDNRGFIAQVNRDNNLGIAGF